MDFKDLERVYKKHMFLKHDPEFLAVVIGTIIANRFDNEPVWLMIVAPPSGGKSRILQPLEASSEVIMRSLITPNALISSAKKKDTHDNKEASLLAQLDGKTLIIRDATAFEGMHPSYRAQIFSQLRCAFDGVLEKSTGLGTKVFKAKFGVIVGTTPITERKKTLESSLGERFLYYRPCMAGEGDPELWEKVMGQAGKESAIKKELANATIEFLEGFKEPSEVMTPHQLVELANQITRLRMSFSRDRNSRRIDYPSEKEMSYRVLKQMCGMYTALYSLTKSTVRVMYIMKMLTLHSAGYYRKRVMDSLKRYRLVGEIATKLGTSRSHIQMTLEELVIAQVVDKKVSGNSTPDEYFLSRGIKKLYVARPRMVI